MCGLSGRSTYRAGENTFSFSHVRTASIGTPSQYLVDFFPRLKARYLGNGSTKKAKSLARRITSLFIFFDHNLSCLAKTGPCPPYCAEDHLQSVLFCCFYPYQATRIKQSEKKGTERGLSCELIADWTMLYLYPRVHAMRPTRPFLR